VGLAPSDSGSGVLAIVSGRFDPERLGAAAEARGATKTAAAGVTYYLLPEKAESSKHGPTAAAFVSTHLVLGGTEAAVVQALAARAAGGTSFASGGGLGAQLTRVNRSASVWALVDVTRYPAVQKGLDRGHGRSESSETTSTLLGAMKSVTLFAFQATVKGDGMDLSASGVARDPDTRQLLEDSLRGVIAMWRLAVQDKSPELVPILRRFHVDSDGDAVTISGNLPSSVLKSLSARHTASR